MKLLFQSEVTGYSSIIKTKTSHSIKHLRLNANKIDGETSPGLQTTQQVLQLFHLYNWQQKTYSPSG